jgi:predicted RNA polymerase sigma factor
VEAGIAWEHCRAPTFADTDWRRIAELYDTLERIAPSPRTLRLESNSIRNRSRDG